MSGFYSNGTLLLDLIKYCNQTSTAGSRHIMKYLLEENFITALLMHVAGYHWKKSTDISCLSGFRSFVDNQYLQEYPVAPELKQYFKNKRNKVGGKYFALQVKTMAKQDAKENFSLLLNCRLAAKLKINPVTGIISGLKNTITLLDHTTAF